MQCNLPKNGSWESRGEISSQIECGRERRMLYLLACYVGLICLFECSQILYLRALCELNPIQREQHTASSKGPKCGGGSCSPFSSIRSLGVLTRIGILPPASAGDAPNPKARRDSESKTRIFFPVCWTVDG